MTTDRPSAPDPQDPLWAAILEAAASIDHAKMGEDVGLLLEMAEEAVTPYADILTEEALAEARGVAVVALVDRPDVEEVLAERRRVRPVRESSGTRAKLTTARLLDAAQRRRGGGGGAA